MHGVDDPLLQLRLLLLAGRRRYHHLRLLSDAHVLILMSGRRCDGELLLGALLLLVHASCEGTARLLLPRWRLLLLLLHDHARLVLLFMAGLVSLVGKRGLPIRIRPARVAVPATAVPCSPRRWIPTHDPPGLLHG